MCQSGGQLQTMKCFTVAAHIHVKALLLAKKATQTYEQAARPHLTLRHSLCPVSAVLLLMAK